MNKQTKILVFAGSTRAGSFNKKLAKLADLLITKNGAQSTLIDLKDFPMPLYDGDYEASEEYPENATKLKQLFKTHNGILIASPEYNSSITGVLKNTIDWLSRSKNAGGDLSAFKGKVIGLASASIGGLGGIRGLVHVRSIFSNIGSIVIPNQFCIPYADKAFDENGKLINIEQQDRLNEVVNQLISMSRCFNSMNVNH